MTNPSGPTREGEPSRYEAAGDSTTSGVNAAYGETAGYLTIPLDEPAVPPRDRRGKSGPRGKSGRARRSWRAAFFALVLTGVAGIAAWALFDSRLLVVRSVVVTGTHLVPRSEVLAAAGIEPGTPLIRVNAAQVAARVGEIRQVRSAQVGRSWPDRVVIVVSERTPALAVAAPAGGFDLVDADGVIVRSAGRRPAALPLYPAPAAVASLRGDPDLAAAAAVLAGLPAQLRQSVTSVTAPSPDQVTLQLSGGITVLWGSADRAAAKAQELTVLEQIHSHYYDVSAQGTLMTK